MFIILITEIKKIINIIIMAINFERGKIVNHSAVQLCDVV